MMAAHARSHTRQAGVLVVDDSNGVGALGATGRGTEEVTRAKPVDVLIATLGNTCGGAISYGMGLGAEKAYERWREKHPGQTGKRAGGRWHDYISYWIHQLGPPALLFSWLPVLGDPLCAVAG